MHRALFTYVLLAILAVGCGQSSGPLSDGDQAAPDFSGVDCEGRVLSLHELLATKPVILHFIEVNCPCSQLAAVHIHRLQDAYGQSVAVIGVINAQANDAKRWKARAGVGFVVLADPWCDVVRSYKVERSVHTVLISRTGKTARVYPRYSADSLRDLNAQLAALLRIPAKSVSTEDAPVKPTAGCTFPE